MFQMLNLWHEISYEIVKGVYVIVAKIYDIMIGLVESTNSYDFTEFTQSIYVVAGLFMLFRVVIGMVQMIINPDQVTDKNAGAGKLITRIVLVIVLLLAFAPTSFLMKQGGVLDRIEQAIIGPDGLLENFSPEAAMNQNYSDIASDILTNNDVIIENVYAGKVKTCYFANLSSKTINAKGIVNTNKYRIDFYNNKCSGCKKVSEYSELYVKANPGTKKYSGEDITFKNIKLANTNKLQSPKLDTIKDCSNWYITVSSNPIVSHNSNPAFITLKNSGKYYAGYNSISDLVTAVEKDKKENPDAYENDLANGIAGIKNDEAVCFATNTISSFQECVGSDTKECQKAKLGQFGGDFCSDEIEIAAGDPTVNELMAEKPPKIELSFMIGIIAGVLIIVFLIILCVDVVIRNLKLMLLDMIAPIPIICYADPKDKVFMNWLKMYFSVYVDLFIKLFAIKIALILIAGFDYDEISGIEYFFVIIAILLFAKMVPSMISKIFGIEFSGSMKDIGNMLKSGAGFATGAAIGGVVGAASGVGAGGSIGRAMLGFGRGALMGAGSGAKGNVLGGAKNIREANVKAKAANRDGSTFGGRTMAGIGSFFGQQHPYEKEKNDIAEEKNRIAEERYKVSKYMAGKDSVSGFKDVVEDNMRNKSGSAGYENVKEVQEWRAAKAAYKQAQLNKNLSAEELARYESAEQAAFKAASDAAQTEEINRVNGRSEYDYDNKAKAALARFDSYADTIGSEKSSSQGFTVKELGAAKKEFESRALVENDKLDREQKAVDERERVNEASSGKADYEAMKRG